MSFRLKLSVVLLCSLLMVPAISYAGTARTVLSEMFNGVG